VLPLGILIAGAQGGTQATHKSGGGQHRPYPRIFHEGILPNFQSSGYYTIFSLDCQYIRRPSAKGISSFSVVFGWRKSRKSQTIAQKPLLFFEKYGIM
jgi:hypothetical protein